WPQRSNRASSELSQVEDHVHGLTVYVAHPAVRDGHADQRTNNTATMTSRYKSHPQEREGCRRRSFNLHLRSSPSLRSCHRSDARRSPARAVFRAAVRRGGNSDYFHSVQL